MIKRIKRLITLVPKTDLSNFDVCSFELLNITLLLFLDIVVLANFNTIFLWEIETL